MSTQIAEAPPVHTPKPATPMPSAREAGLVNMADAFQKAAKAPPASPETTAVVEQPVVETKTVQGKPALLEGLEPEVKPEVAKPAPESKEAREAKTAADWKLVKGERDAAKAEVETLKKQVADAEALKKRLADLEPKANKADEYAKRLHEVAFEKTDAYRELVDGQKQILDTARQLATDFEAPEGAIEQALALKGKKRFDFLQDTFGAAGVKFDGMLEQYELAEVRKQSEIQRSRENVEKMDAAERELALSEQTRQREEILQTFDLNLSRYAAKFPGYFAKNGDADHNAQVDQIVETCKTIASSTDPEVQADALVLAGIARSVIPRAAALERENALLKKRLSEFNEAEPSLPTGSENDATDTGKPQGMMEHLRTRR